MRKLPILSVTAGAIGFAAVATSWLRREVVRTVFLPDACRDEISVAAGRLLLSSGAPHDVPILYSPGPPEGPTVVFFHGNAQAVASSTPLFDDLRPDGIGVAAVEYVGYGSNPAGPPSEAATLQACEDALRVIRARSEVGEIVLVGYSLGSVFATALAAKGYGDRVILAAAFTSAAAIARAQTRFAPTRLLLGSLDLDNLAKAPQVHVPVLLIHSDADEAFPLAMARELEAALPAGHLIPLSGLSHSDTGRRLAAAVRAATSAPERWPSSEEELLMRYVGMVG